MTDPEPTRSIELDIEVPGTPEEVWAAIATGPGISAWFVPSTVDGREGGTVTMDFGSGMKAEGTVTRWDPPHAFAYAGGDGLAYEYLVEARDGGTCVVRLVNTGFGAGTEWDGQYDGMTEGWKLFLDNLLLHRTHFPGQACRSIVVNGEGAWEPYVAALGLPASPSVGDDVTATGPRPLAGEVVRVAPGMVTLLTRVPAPGIAFVAAEGTALSFYGYFYGPTADDVAGTEGPRWEALMADRFPTVPA
jgi:uncharacterized protein YndB with AHSA1/START domain